MSVSPAVMRRLMRELTELKKNPPEGIRVVTSEENMLDVTGVIEGPEGTPYAGGYFKVKFKFTEEFPAAPPKCWFVSKIFHPNVSASGEICVNTLKKDWNSSYGIGHILITVKCLLIYPNPESALDEEAGKLLLENYDSYCERARLITSVHATPRVRPPEFDTPSGASVSTPTSAIPSTGTTRSKSVTLPSQSPPSAISVLSVPASTPANQKSTSPAPVARPLRASPPNTFINVALPSSTPLSTDKGGGKEVHSTPTPLGTADANVGAVKGAGMENPCLPSVLPANPKKSVKRSAGGGGSEKRKKALKRL